MPEAARTFFSLPLTLIQYVRKHAVELAGIKKQTFAGGTEIKLSLFDDHYLEMASATAWTFAAAFAKFEVEYGVECCFNIGCIFVSS